MSLIGPDMMNATLTAPPFRASPEDGASFFPPADTSDGTSNAVRTAAKIMILHFVIFSSLIYDKPNKPVRFEPALRFPGINPRKFFPGRHDRRRLSPEM
jgi:hypothetical protein